MKDNARWQKGKPLASSLCDKSLRLTWEINQATSKCQIDFWIKLAKKSKVEK